MLAKPTLFFSVPRLYEKIQERVTQKILESNIIVKRSFSYSTRHGEKIFNKIINGKSLSLKERYIQEYLKMLHSKIGLEKVQFFFAGAAPLQLQT